MTGKILLTSALFLAMAVFFVVTAPLKADTRTTQSVSDGVYTGAQADRGRGQYVQHCAVCHGAALEGNGETPPLVGQFIPDWAGMTLADIYDKIQTTMPLNAPGTLRPAIAVDILAYIIRANNFPAGSKELAPDSLKAISFDVINRRPTAPGQK